MLHSLITAIANISENYLPRMKCPRSSCLYQGELLKQCEEMSLLQQRDQDRPLPSRGVTGCPDPIAEVPKK